ncbi:hypothetical protein J2810_002562 [Chryseobacterium rhizosphaerae]|uniref:hypothetical protein n=1 Tax=Chryseobacterium rhizosphaerae TaxID=395937 RepID=UPI002856B87C|nr:hypothetical protein [Chryseobacterium rhizosphaerae]MDR6546503.1 hypothetical protein [Chryseobacterium rhizosphaerae]
MGEKYLIFKKDELAKSRILAKELAISDGDFIKIQNWFDLLLLKHEEATTDWEDQLQKEEDLENKFNELISSEIERKSYKYILPKLLNYNNEFNGAFLRSLYVVRLGALLRDNLIFKFVNDKMIVYSAEDFFHTTVYLSENYFVSPNSNFLEDILKMEHVRGILKQATVNVKCSTLKNILHIIHQKTFHHDIICFKKILKLVSPEDVALIDYLKKFQVANRQGCYKIINDIFTLEIAEDKWLDFEIKVQLINFFDTGRGANPSAGWKKKFQELSGTIDSKKLLLTANNVLKNDNCKNFEFDYGAQWGDDTAKRFLKTAQWITDILR